MGCDTGHPRDFRHDSGGGGDAGYDPTGGGGGGGGHSAHFDPMPDTFHAEFITQVMGLKPIRIPPCQKGEAKNMLH